MPAKHRVVKRRRHGATRSHARKRTPKQVAAQKKWGNFLAKYAKKHPSLRLKSMLKKAGAAYRRKNGHKKRAHRK